MTTRAWHDSHFEHTAPDTHPNRWRRFIEIDPWNPENRVEGWIQVSGGEEYGSIVVETVNGRPAPQRILAMPKTSYPFFKDGSWVLQGVSEIHAYVKLDGTNVCQYAYRDAGGVPFTSFKVRVRPFMAPFFIGLMEQVLERYPGVKAKELLPGQCLMYELYGHANPMLIRYAEEIELALLFGRDREGRIVTLAHDDPLFAGVDCPRATHRPIGPAMDIETEYRRRQAVYSEELTAATDEQFDGNEGEMLYVTFPEGQRTAPGSFTRLIKLKAHQIEEIHWASDHISRNELEATARNVFEYSDNPTEQDMVQLLAEDWGSDQIQRSMESIRAVLDAAVERRRFQDRVLEVFRQHCRQADLQQDHRLVMRTLSQHFPRNDMRRVFNALVERGLLPGKD